MAAASEVEVRLRILWLLVPITAITYCLTLFGQSRDATLWVTLGDSDQVVEVDAYSFTELRRIKTDPKPHGLAASSDGSRIYVASDQTGNMQAIDARRGTVVEQIRLGNDPNQLVLTKDDRFAYVPLRGEDQVAVVQLQATRERLYPPPEHPDPDMVYVSSGTAVRRLTSAFNALAADVYWIRAIQYFGATRVRLAIGAPSSTSSWPVRRRRRVFHAASSVM